MRRLRLAAALFAVAIAAVFVTTATAHHRPPVGFKTAQDAMLDCPTCTSVTPIITVGETLPGSTYRFESIPDGISIVPSRRGGDDDDDDGGGGRTAEILVNHETSTVPFPLTPVTLNDFDNSQLSRITLNTRTAGVLSGFYAIPSSANYQRFCSNFMATKEHGFSRPMLFTNEEATDLVNRTGTAFPAGPGAEQAGVVVAYDPRNGEYKTIYGMGRHNHENSVALPGYRKPVILSGDDTFAAPSSQLYMYLARNADEVWNDQGSLWAFKSDNPLVNDYGDLSGTASVSGTFIPVPRDIAIGNQTGLESWSNTNNVFQFIRLEDIAYDRKRSNIVYMADTGEPRAIPGTTRLARGPAVPPALPGQWSNGRIFKFEFDKKDPTVVKKLSILIDGDVRGAAGVKALDLIHQPDNLETTKDHLYIQEDPGSHNHYAINDPLGTTARIWQYDLKRKTLRVLATVDQGADEGPTDTDPSAAALWGAWESSGIVDASSIFGKGAFLVDIQAPSLVVERQVQATQTLEREGGQLLLIRVGKGGHHGDHDDDDDDD